MSILLKELASLRTALLSRAATAPASAKARATNEIHAMFQNYEKIQDETQLESLHLAATRKLSVLDMSFSQDKDISVNQPGVTRFIVKDGEAKEGKSEDLVNVNWSNWYGGNADPEDLQRHKALVDRQHFAGPVWEGRQRNPLAWEEPPDYAYVAPDEEPDEEWRKKREAEGFEQVRR